MTAYPIQPALDLFAAPLRVDGAVERLGRALWLYLWLVSIANVTGRVCRTTRSLANDLAVPEGRVTVWLSRLVDNGLVVAQGRSPYLVLKLRFWPRDTRDGERKNPENSSNSDRSQREVPVSSQQQAAAASSKEDGGVGEGDSLLDQAREILGEAGANEVRELLSQFPREVVTKALLRVKVTPPYLIRKSKTALFRFLLAKFANESHART